MSIRPSRPASIDHTAKYIDVIDIAGGGGVLRVSLLPEALSYCLPGQGCLLHICFCRAAPGQGFPP